MTAGLLSRVKFIGGDSGADAPPLDTTPTEPSLPGLDPDPEPAPDTRSAKQARKSAASANTSAKQSRSGGKFVSTSKIQADIADELNSYAKMVALTWSMSDETCAAVLNETSEAITKDLAALLARSEWVREKFTTTSMLADCFKLLHHAWPLLRAVYAHHLSPARHDEEGEHDAVTVGIPVDPDAYAPWRPGPAVA